MDNRIEREFPQLKKQKKGGFILFLAAGDHDSETTEKFADLPVCRRIRDFKCRTGFGNTENMRRSSLRGNFCRSKSQNCLPQTYGLTSVSVL